ncbi:MAG: hypothetical protein LBL21_01265 [Rickettsiales bacterium]|nr:hypothetical protein [Rickettsiales bacterium]
MHCALGFAAAPIRYRSIDEEYVPKWDEFVPGAEKTNYDDKYDMGEYSPGEWNWWNLADERNDDYAPEKFWNEEIDYDTFERYSPRENLDNKGMILTDTRSCPDGDTVNCKDWLAAPHRIEALPTEVGYIPKAREKTESEKEVEKLLKNKTEKKERMDKWSAGKDKDMWGSSDEFRGCPLETEAECIIWKTKPTVPETLSNRTPAISSAALDGLIVLSRAGNAITSDMRDAVLLVNRYRALMASSRACCTSGLVYNLREAGASKGLIYKFMVDDANFYQFGERCLTITDDELDENYADTSTAEVVADIRNTCLCKKKEYFETLLAPFTTLAEASPAFASSTFGWQYTDGLKRKVAVSINRDVNVVLKQLENCPD